MSSLEARDFSSKLQYEIFFYNFQSQYPQGCYKLPSGGGRGPPPDLEIKVGRFGKKLAGLGKSLRVWGKSSQIWEHSW